MRLYRVVRRAKGSDGEWTQVRNHNRRDAVYTKSGPAKSFATYENKSYWNKTYDYRVEVTETDWKPLDERVDTNG